MLVGLDVRMLKNSGIGTTIRGLLNNVTPAQRQQMELFGGEEPQKYPVYGLAQHWAYGRMLNRQNLTLYHMPHFDVPLAYQGPLVVTVHDLIHYFFPEYSTKPFSRAYSGFMLRRVAKRAQRIIMHSENTRRDFLSLFPETDAKIRVLYPAVEAEFKPVAEATVKTVLAGYSLAPGYLLYVGNLRESKNTRGLLKAYLKARAQAPDLPPLVLVGRNSLKGFDPDAQSPYIRHLKEIPAEHLTTIYSGASLFVFPSFYEGFGLPPMEAMACGVPVAASPSGSLEEICGDAAAYMDPHSLDSMASVMVQLSRAPAARQKLREKGFERVKRYSWHSFAQKTWGVYEEVAGELKR